MALPIMADFGDHVYFKKKKFFLQLSVKRSKPVHMDFMIYLNNLGNKDSENPKKSMSNGLLL